MNQEEKLEVSHAIAEQLGAAKEAIRILDALTAEGSTGDHFEIPWPKLIAIIGNNR
jgi:hypothetical protein